MDGWMDGCRCCCCDVLLPGRGPSGYGGPEDAYDTAAANAEYAARGMDKVRVLTCTVLPIVFLYDVCVCVAVRRRPSGATHEDAHGTPRWHQDVTLIPLRCPTAFIAVALLADTLTSSHLPLRRSVRCVLALPLLLPLLCSRCVHNMSTRPPLSLSLYLLLTPLSLLCLNRPPPSPFLSLCLRAVVHTHPRTCLSSLSSHQRSHIVTSPCLRVACVRVCVCVRVCRRACPSG